MIVEVLHDRYWYKVRGELVKNSRHEDPRWPWADYDYPAVVELTSNPKSGNANVRINKAWLDYVEAINNPTAFKLLMTVAQGWVNGASNPSYKYGTVIPKGYMPVIEAMTCVGNRHEAIGRKNGSYCLLSFNVKNKPPDPKKINPKNNPYYFVKITSISKTGVVRPALHNAVVPLLAKGDLWITGDKVKAVK